MRRLSREPPGPDLRPTRVSAPFLPSLLRRRPAAAVGVGLAALVALAGCATVRGHDGAGAADCAAVIRYDGHRYWGLGGLKRTPEVTGRSVSAVLPGCDDTGGKEPPPAEPVEAQQLAAVDPTTALLFNGAVYVRDGRELPRSTRMWFRAPRCTTTGDFEVTADWLGVTGPREPRFDGDLRPPYRLEVRVTAGPQRYVGTTVMVRTTATTDPALSPADVKRSLWQGGQVVASVRCVDGTFEALELRAREPS